jgi:hypothetical protein
MAPLPAAPGDVLAVWSSNSASGTLIRVGAVLRGRPGVANHVAVITHADQRKRWIGIEGRPGGVGPVDCTHWLTDSRTRSNHGQPRPGGDRARDTFLGSCAQSLGIAYDWTGIAQDVLKACKLEDLAAAIDPLWRWPTDKHDVLPGHVVCSSLAAMLYARVGWARPEAGKERTCTPADWWNFSDQRQWERGGPG